MNTMTLAPVTTPNAIAISPSPLQSPSQPQQKTHAIAIIDAAVDHAQQLIDGLMDGVEGHILNAHQDGIQQITRIMQDASRRAIASLHIIAHGSPGTLELGNSELRLSTLAHYADAVTTWFGSSPPEQSPQLALYSCNVAMGDAGAEFLSTLHQLTGASIAASSTPIGHSSQGGNWQLDTRLHQPQIQAQIQPILSAQTQATYPGTLSTRLNAPLLAGRDVLDFELSADGSTLIYRADQDNDDVFELYKVAIGGGTPTKLSGTLVAGGDVSDGYAITANGAAVVYRADQDVDGSVELFSAPMGGGAPTQLNGAMPIGGNISNFQISADGSTVVFRGDEDIDNQFELYRVPIGGGGRTQLNPVLPAGGDVYSDYKLSANGVHVVYRADQDIDGDRELYSVPIGGGVSTQLNGTLPVNGDILDFKLSPDGSIVVFRGDEDVNGDTELYSVPIGGGSRTQLNSPLVAGGDVTNQYELTPTTVVYRADEDTDGVLELYSVPITGGAQNKLNGALGANQDVEDFTVSGDGSTVVYLADQDADEVFELYSIPVGGGTPTKLNSTLAGGFGDVVDYVISADGSRVVYLADQDADEVFELYSVPLSGGPSTKLNGALTPNGDIADFKLSDDGLTVVYRADQDADDVFELYGVATAGGAATKLNGALVANGDVEPDYVISADGNTVIYLADETTNDVVELYSAAIAGAVPTAPTVSFTTDSQSGSEGGGNLVVTVQLSEPSTSDVVVPFSVAGTAIAGDYTLTPTPLTILAGETSGTIVIDPVDDAIAEPMETIVISMGTPTNGTPGSITTHTATLIDNDSASGIPGTTLGTPISPNLPRENRIRGTKADDVLKGTRRGDVILGRPGEDTLIGRKGNDLLKGAKDDDILRGGQGDDDLRGGRGEDIIRGQAGNDLIVGGKDNDLLIGGGGKDMFRYGKALNDGTDTIRKFQVAEDVFDLRRIFARPEFGGSDDVARLSEFVTLVEVSGSTEIHIDKDGNGVGSEVAVIAVLQNTTGLTTANFVI